jgi:hypothetical protein
LAAPIKAAPPNAPADQTVFHRTMVVTVERLARPFNPADRIEAVDITIRPENGVITSWDTAATQYSTINAGSLQLTGTSSFTGSGSIGTPSTAPDVASLSNSFTVSQSRQENYTATEQVETLTVSLRNPDSYKLDPTLPNELRIHRQGGIGVDLTGNVVLKVDIAIPQIANGTYATIAPILPSRRSIMSVNGDYFDDSGTRADPDSLKLSIVTNRIAASVASVRPPSIFGKATLVYTLRHIVTGDATLEERDDDIREETREIPNVRVVLVPGSDVVPRAFSIMLGEAPLMIIRGGATLPTRVCFGSYGEAADFLGYLQTAPSHPERFAHATLVLNDLPRPRPLTEGQVGYLKVIGHCIDEGPGAAGF